MNKLSEFRNQIDHIHQQMADLMSARLKIAEEIWKLKKSKHLVMTDIDREQQLLNIFDNDPKYSDAEKKVLRAVFETTILETKKYLNDKK